MGAIPLAHVRVGWSRYYPSKEGCLMAQTDPSDAGPNVVGQSWTFREWLNGVRSWFSGGQKFLVSGGAGNFGGKVPPALAVIARARLGDRIGTGIRSRMEEAKQKNMMWENDLEPLI